jgi:ABC-type antimicrobial peptide transport system permease subunit
MYILTNGDDADDDFEYFMEGEQEEDLVKSGRVKDIDLATNKIKIKKGDAPQEAYETIINIDQEDEVKIGKTVPIKIAGRKLKVVGYYTSDSADDDTYYVHADTIREDYIQKQKEFSAYSEDPSLLKSILSKEGLSAKANDSRDRKAYINARKDQLTSAIIVAGIIMLISLIEMFLMLRSSFLSRIKEVGTLRAIGLKKKDIYRMFTGEILVITFLTAVPGIALMYFGLSQVVKITYYLEGMYMLKPVIAAVAFGVILVFNLLAGLIPVYVTMKKTPAQILARTDI